MILKCIECNRKMNSDTICKIQELTKKCSYCLKLTKVLKNKYELFEDIKYVPKKIKL